MKNQPKFFVKKAQPLDIPKMGVKKKGNKLRVAGVLTLTTIILSITGTSAYGIYSFFDRYELQSPVVIRLPYKEKEIVSPIPKEDRVKAKVSFIPKVEASELKRVKAPVELKEIVEYIAYKFEPEGKDVVVRAINCFYSESGLREKAVGHNSDDVKSTDYGVAQLNDHWHSLTEEEKTEYKANIDRAYKIYKGRGDNFSAWYGKACNN